MARAIKDDKGCEDESIVGTIGQNTIGILATMASETDASATATNLRISGFNSSFHGPIVRIFKLDALDVGSLKTADRILNRESLGSYSTIVTIDRPSFQRSADMLRKAWGEFTPRSAAGYLDPCSPIGAVDLFDVLARDNDSLDRSNEAIQSAGYRLSGDGLQLATVYRWTSSYTASLQLRRLLRSAPDVDDEIKTIVRSLADRMETADRPCPPLHVAAAEHASDLDYSLAAPSTREARSAPWTNRLDRIARACVGSDVSGVVGDTGHGDGSMQAERGGYTIHGSPVTGEKSNRQTGKRIGKGSGGNARTNNTPAILAYRAHYRPVAVKVIAPWFRACVDAIHPDVQKENRRRSKLHS